MAERMSEEQIKIENHDQAEVIQFKSRLDLTIEDLEKSRITAEVIPIKGSTALAGRAAEDLGFYREGLQDFTGGRKHTEAAIGYAAYWSTQG